MVDVDDAVREPFDQRGAKDLHVPSEHDQIDQPAVSGSRPWRPPGHGLSSGIDCKMDIVDAEMPADVLVVGMVRDHDAEVDR